jgi:hypothetical protein
VYNESFNLQLIEELNFYFMEIRVYQKSTLTKT